MIYLRRFNESLDKIEIIDCDKSIESYEFIIKYLDIIDFEDYIRNSNLYQVCAYLNTKLVGVSIFRMKDGNTPEL